MASFPTAGALFANLVSDGGISVPIFVSILNLRDRKYLMSCVIGSYGRELLFVLVGSWWLNHNTKVSFPAFLLIPL